MMHDTHCLAATTPPTTGEILTLAALLILGAIVLVVQLALLARINRQRWTRVEDSLGSLLQKRGWQPTLGFPPGALNLLDEDTFLAGATIVNTHYSCTHRHELNGAAVHVGFVKPAGRDRRVDAGTVVVATEALRAPLTCLIAAKVHAQPFAQQLVADLRVGAGRGFPLHVHFYGTRDADDPDVAATLRIVELVFANAEEVFTGDTRALLGRGGLVITGPVVGEAVVPLFRTRRVAIEPFIRGAERLLDNCHAVWNARQAAEPQ